MKIKCIKCGKIVDESKIIKSGWNFYFCSEKCLEEDKESRWTMGIILLVIGIILLFIFG